MDINALVTQFKQKDEKAFQSLYEMYSESMLGVVFNIVKDNTIAEEVVQDVFIKAWNNADSYSEKKGRFFTWILNIARNAAIDKIRSKSYKKANQNLNADFFVDIIESNDNLDRNTDAIGIRKFVSQMGEKCKKLIDLLYLRGYTQKEASETLEMPIGTIKTNNRNCIKELRIMLDVK